MSAQDVCVTTTNLLTTAEAAAAIGLQSVSTISRWVESGRISPAMKLPGATGPFLFDPAEVERVRAEYAATLTPSPEGAEA